jgi:LmbE family N-acetylglucosaminyl deacetylase
VSGHGFTRRELALLGLAEGAGAAHTAKRKTMLLAGGHMDDAEWGAAGLMLKAIQTGYRVVIVQTVGDWSNYWPAQGHEQRVKQGVLRLARDMGAEKILLDYKYHEVPVDLQIKRRIAEIVAEVQPDIALVPAETDYWTDHANTSRAAKDGIMFVHGYMGRKVEGPKVVLAYPTGANQTHDFRPDVFIDTTSVIDRVSWVMNQLDLILSEKESFSASMTLYGSSSEGYPKKMDLSPHAERVLAASKVWGDYCGVRYAEAFQSIRRLPNQLL